MTSRLFRRRTIGCVPYNYKYGCVPTGLFRGVNIACFDVIEIDATPFMDADESRLIRTYGSIVIGGKTLGTFAAAQENRCFDISQLV